MQYIKTAREKTRGTLPALSAHTSVMNFKNRQDLVCVYFRRCSF